MRPVGEGTRAECEVRLQYEAASVDDEGVQQALALCSSMSTAVPR